MPKSQRDDAVTWATWLEEYGAENFYHSFMATAQNAESFCELCEEKIYLDIAEGGGVPDWRTVHGDYGCLFATMGPFAEIGNHSPTKLRTS